MAVTINGSGQVPVQVVSATKTDTFGTSSTSYSDVTGLSVTITPTSASNKILIIYTVQMAFACSSAGILSQLVRNSTPICIGDAASSRPRVSVGAYAGDFSVSQQSSLISGSNNFLDSPATTSPVTYKIQMASTTGGVTVYVNRSISDRDTSLYDPRTASSITVMEISG